jgi:GT2 family glycosyltransferase/glycosyltransferase involved in cell wall biosynthesis
MSRELREFLHSSAVFDHDWYARTFPDVELSGLDPTEHYIHFGLLVGRPPSPVGPLSPLNYLKNSPRFCLEAYRLANPQVPKDPSSALLHHLLHQRDQTLIINWLDFALDNLCGSSDRIRINSLLNVLLREEDENKANESFRAAQLREMMERLSAALQGYPAPSIHPKATIVVPVYNQIFHTLACAVSLFESRPITSFELIIANDCSTDETAKVFGTLSPWIRVATTSSNLGFLRNCNNGAKAAAGEFIVMLNNDTIVLPSWLDALVDTLTRNQSCGMVGSKLLNLDGTLQEAGAIYWRDGSAWNFGRNQDQRAPQFGYLKEVDYCSGASICLRTETWRKLGGFDEEFTPAYCEEVDLAFRLREQLGLSTIYQPQSALIHLEGISHGRDVTAGLKQYQVENQCKLFDRYKSVFERDHFDNGSNIFLARDRSRGKPHMLFVDHYVPTPDRDAGSRQMDAYLRLFAKLGYQITFWPDNLAYDPINTPVYQQLGIEVMNSAAGHIAFDDWVQEHGPFLDVAFLSRPHVAPSYFPALKAYAPSCLCVFYGHDLHMERIRRQMKIEPSPELEEELSRAKKWEFSCWDQADVVSYPSQDECDFVNARFRDKKTFVLPLYCVSEEIARYEATKSFFSDRSGLLFVGGFNHPPNTAAVVWFIKDILPLVIQHLQEVEFIVAGVNPPAELVALAHSMPNIRFTGHISDEELAALYERARVAVAPLRFGAGVKGKVVESLMKGLPIVTTSIGTQGLDESAEAITRADDPAEFASKVIALYSSPDAWERQRNNGFLYFSERFLEQSVARRLSEHIPHFQTRFS